MKTWQEEFDEKFIGDKLTPSVHTIVTNKATYASDIEINGNFVKDFISQLLEKERKEAWEEGYEQGQDDMSMDNAGIDA